MPPEGNHKTKIQVKITDFGWVARKLLYGAGGREKRSLPTKRSFVKLFTTAGNRRIILLGTYTSVVSHPRGAGIGMLIPELPPVVG